MKFRLFIFPVLQYLLESYRPFYSITTNVSYNNFSFKMLNGVFIQLCLYMPSPLFFPLPLSPLLPTFITFSPWYISTDCRSQTTDPR